MKHLDDFSKISKYFTTLGYKYRMKAIFFQTLIKIFLFKLFNYAIYMIYFHFIWNKEIIKIKLILYLLIY